MYTSTAFFMATATASLLTFFLYPVISTLTSFYWFELDNGDFHHMLDWMSVLILTAFAGSLWGFALGTFVKSEVTAIHINLMFAFFYNFGGGFVANLKEGQNIVIKGISYISPMRYSSELLMRRIID